MPAALRFPCSQSRGRRYREQPHPYRNIYQRDRDRVIHSRAFRRLEYKTQVFTIPDSDHLRNRLTHTIEVSQIARTVAGALHLNEDLVEALALAHDIGHPPFGHAGETVLNHQMERFGESFDHNLHALRIVEHFEQRYAAHPGLNLTFEVREGIVKHSNDYSPEAFPKLSEYLLYWKPPLEAQLIDPADELTYDCADLDDAVDAGLLDVKQVRQDVELFDRFLRDAEREFPRAEKRLVFNEALRRLLDALVSGLIEGTSLAIEEAGVRSVADLRQHSDRLARLSAAADETSKQLRELLSREVYNSPELSEAREETGKKLAALFAFFMEHPDSLPDFYRSQAENLPLHRVVCDYLAGMTDKFLLRRSEALLGS
jgi:dGTPase